MDPVELQRQFHHTTLDERDRLRAVLRELVELKDGPRDEDYERRKPLAWQAAREVLALSDGKDLTDGPQR